MPILVLMFFFLIYGLYIFALKLLIDVLINMLYICKFEQQDFEGKYL